MSSEAAPVTAPGTATAAHDTINDLFHKIIGPFAATFITPLMIEPHEMEDRVNTLVQELNTHPYLIPPFQKLVQSLQKKEGVAALEEQIRFFQTTHTRDWLFVNLLNEVLQVKELKLDEQSGRLPGKPDDLLHFSHKARVEFGEESRYKDLMCTIGLLFDFIFYLQKTSFLNLNGLKFDEMIKLAFKTGVEQGKLVVRLSRHKPKLLNEKHAPVIPLLRQLSHVIFCLLYPTIGPEFYKKLAATPYTEPLKLALEMKEFGVHSGMVASYIAQSFSIFDPLGEVMSVWGMPHLAHYTKEPAIHDLATLAELGVLIKENFKIGSFSESSKVGFTIPELKFLDFTLTAKIREDLVQLEGKS